MQSQILSFELVDLLHFFNVDFETESRARNRILEIELKGFKLDVPELRNTHPLLYIKIKEEMQKVSNDHWNQEEDIPTLRAYQQVEIKSETVFDRIRMHSFPHLTIFFLFLLAPLFSIAQVNADLGAGYDVKSGQVISSLSVGFQSHNVVTEAVLTPTLTRKINCGNYAGFKIGYNIAGAGIIPSIGYYYNYYNNDQKFQYNCWCVGYSLKAIIPVNDNGGLFLNGMYINHSEQVSAGFHIEF